MPRARLLFLAAAVLSIAACGGSGDKQDEQQIALVQGTSDYAVGPVRSAFLVIDAQSRAIQKPAAAVTVDDEEGNTVLTTTARLEPIGIPGQSEAATGGVKDIYVARFRIDKPGRYTLHATPEGTDIKGVTTLDVREKPKAPAVGDEAIPSRTPTLESTNGNLAALTTAEPPDRSLLRHSIADSVKAHLPFVVVFATPKYCTSRTCGPSVDVVQAVQKKIPGRYIHVEIYKDNNPASGPNRWVKEWRLPSEPWVFVVGRDGRIKARFEGSVSVPELEQAVRTVFRTS